MPRQRGRIYFMDRAMPKEVAKSSRLNDRYILKECLFSNELGQLYHARDTRHSAGMAPGADVLVHLFPDQAISYTQLANTFNRLQTMINASLYPVLPVLDYGWVGNSAYFVMVTTGSWSTKVLPGLRGEPGHLHRDAIQLTSKLLKEQVISRGLVPQAFLVIPGGLKVLGTVLTEQFQEIQLEMDLLPPDSCHKKDRKVVPMALSFGILAGIAVAGSTYFYQQPELINESVINTPEIHSKPTPSTLASNPATAISPAIEILTAGTPETEKLQKQSTAAGIIETKITPEKSAKTIISAFTQPEPTVQLPEVPTQATTIILMEDLPNSFPATEFPDKDQQAKNKGHIIAAPSEKRLNTQLIFADTIRDQSKTTGKKFDHQTASSNQDKKTDKENLTANSLNREQLIERAYAAIREGNLSEQTGAGSIYYIRLLKRTSPAHPQVRRLAREVVSAYHIKARTSIKLKQAREASQHLWIAGHIIEEFSLREINRSHLVLKQRLAE